MDSWKTLAEPSNPTLTVAGSSPAASCANAIDGGAERDARAQPERDVHRRQLARVVDALRADGFLHRHDGRQRNERAARRLEGELVERIGVLLVLRIELEQHAVLRRVAVDRGRPLRAEAGGERVLDLGGVEADGGRLVAIDDEVHLRALDLEVVRDVLDLRDLRLHRRAQPLRPGVELIRVGALHRHVVAAVALAEADLQRRRDPDERAEVREPQQLRPELLRDLLRRDRTLRPRQRAGSASESSSSRRRCNCCRRGSSRSCRRTGSS